MEQFVDLKRLADEIARTALDRFHGVLHRPEARDHDRDDVRVARHRRLDHGGPVDARQSQVGHDDVEREFGEARERRLARLGLPDPIAAVVELLGDGLAKRCFVLDQQEMFQGIRHLPGAPIF